MSREHRNYNRNDRGRQYNRQSSRGRSGTSRGGSRRRGSYEEQGGSLMMPLLILIVIGIGAYMYSGRDWREDWQSVKAMAEQYLPQQEASEELPVYRAPCTQANIARIIAYTFLDEIPKTQDPGEMWYKKYYAALAKDPRFTFFDETNAQKPLTYEETSKVLSDLLGASGNVNLQGSESVKTKPIALKTFLEGYESALSYAKMEAVLSYETLGIVATPKTNGGLG
ncbi:MAG: hypothetical protein ACRCTE_06495, partial [Cellulosilyticaceae bacterium]